MARKGGLGKGLDALIPSKTPATRTAAQLYIAGRIRSSPTRASRALAMDDS